jgi:drug/metabolite transporter (DMT)-like permease
MAGGSLRIFVSAVGFVLSGLAQTVTVQAVLYSGGGDRSTFLVALPNYIGILLVYIVGGRVFRALDSVGVWEARKAAADDPAAATSNRVHHSLYARDRNPGERPATTATKRAAATGPKHMSVSTRLFHPERRKLFVLAFNELGGFLSGITGLSIAGSGLYQVVFSGGAVFTALLSVFFLRRRLTCLQWFFVGFITVGLMITAEQVTHPSAPSAAETAASTLQGAGAELHAANLISGVAFVLVSCLFYSTNYVIAEHFLEPPETPDLDEQPPELPPPSGLDLSLVTGGSCLIVFTFYVMMHTIPHWNELVTLSIERHRGNATLIIEQYVYLVIAAFLHAITHYDIVATVGAVPVGVLNSVRAVSVFAASSMLFCEHQASQCYTARKGMSTAIVIIGALGYSAATASATSAAAATGRPIQRTSNTERRQRLRRTPSTSGSPVERSLSAPFLNDAAASSGSWFQFKRRKESEI